MRIKDIDDFGFHDVDDDKDLIPIPCFGGPCDGGSIAGTGPCMLVEGNQGRYLLSDSNGRYEWRQ